MTEDQEELLLKAQQSVAAAQLLLGNDYTDFAASRAYYAMFYAAEAQVGSARPGNKSGAPLLCDDAPTKPV